MIQDKSKLWPQRAACVIYLLACQSPWTPSHAEVVFGGDTVPSVMNQCWTRSMRGSCHAGASQAVQFWDSNNSAILYLTPCGTQADPWAHKAPTPYSIHRTVCYCPGAHSYCDIQTMLRCRDGVVEYASTQDGTTHCAYFSERAGILHWWQRPSTDGISASQAFKFGPTFAPPTRTWPKKPSKVEESLDWCDCGAGTGFLKVWVSDKGEPTKISDLGKKQLVFSSHVSSVKWACDGMDEPQTTYFAKPTRFVTIQRTVEAKTLCWAHHHQSGRLHWTTWQEAGDSVESNGPTYLSHAEKNWDWCDCGTGANGQLLWVWPEGELNDKVAVYDGQMLAFRKPTTKLNWLCEGMDTPQSSTFSEPVRIWSIKRSIEIKPVLCGKESGRVAWQAYREDSLEQQNVFQDSSAKCPHLEDVLDKVERSDTQFTTRHHKEEYCVSVDTSDKAAAFAGFLLSLMMFPMVAFFICVCVRTLFKLQSKANTISDEHGSLHAADDAETAQRPLRDDDPEMLEERSLVQSGENAREVLSRFDGEE